MRPFQKFRLWTRRAPLGQRIGAAVVCLLAIAGVGWLVAPGGQHSTNLSTPGVGGGSAGTAGGQNSTGMQNLPGGTTASSVPGASSAQGTPGAAASATGVSNGSSAGGSESNGTGVAPVGGSSTAGCAQPAANTPGVTSKQIKVAITLTTIVGPAANSTFGIPSVSQQQAYYQDVIDSINGGGGVDCRQLVPQFYTVNAADQASQEQTCLDIGQAGVFAELDFTAYSTVGGNCFGQQHLPFFIDYFVAAESTKEFYPYIFGLNTYTSLYHNAIPALAQQGFFSPSNGFKKLGFVYRDCFPEVPSEILGMLKQVGVPSSEVVTYDVGCPAAFASPADLEQAVLKFKQAGVTNVTTGYFLGDFGNFTTIAEQQNFQPKYGIGDDDTVNITYGSQHPNYNNIAGAIAIVASRYGEEHTPGMSPTPATNRCNSIFTSHGQPPVYQQPVGAGGEICDELWMFAAAVEHAPALSPAALGAGLQASRSVDFSYPQGPNDFTGYRATTGGQYWRTDEFFESCDCWRVIDPNFHSSFS